jgi:nicotinate-nucleotide--dimethylbenzimidazole phosphoribosyltransferase
MPPGALGRLESLALRLAGIRQTLTPRTDRKRILTFAADHGIAAAGVSAFPQEVTAQMVANFAAGGAAINVLCRDGGIEHLVFDVGVAASLDCAGVVSAPVRRGTRNFLKEPAMTAEECEKAWRVGSGAADTAREDGVDLLGIGEMGIGNSTSAAALLCAILDLPAEVVVGRGTGVDNAGLGRKVATVKEALRIHRETCGDRARDWLAAVGGYEIAAMAGAIERAVAVGIPLVVDGFIATASATVVMADNPLAREGLFFSHCSAEGGHGRVLQELEVEPILDLDLRLGEGTGAALAMPIVSGSAALLREMATFRSAGVAEKGE